MLNQLVLVGRLQNDLELEKYENKVKLDIINNDKVITCYIYNDIALRTLEYCKKDDLVGIKGHLTMEDNKLEIVVEKITFLSCRDKEQE